MAPHKRAAVKSRARKLTYALGENLTVFFQQLPCPETKTLDINTTKKTITRKEKTHYISGKYCSPISPLQALIYTDLHLPCLVRWAGRQQSSGASAVVFIPVLFALSHPLKVLSTNIFLLW